jgi:myosin heavy subunit
MCTIVGLRAFFLFHMASLGKYTPVPADSVDIDEILSKDSNVVAQQLHSRVLKDKPFTRIGNRLIVSVRPSRGLSLFSDDSSKEYAQQAKEVAKSNQTQSPQPLPHVFNISASAYLHALRGKMDQSIVLL